MKVVITNAAYAELLQIAHEIRKHSPARAESFVSELCDRCTSEPNNATPRTLPVCRVELSTPAATPERGFSTLPSSVEVSGGLDPG
jgi:hypothetical protein